MRHRAQRPLLHRLTVPGPARRGLIAAAALVVAATLTGVGVAAQDGEPRPSAAGGPLPTPDAPAPSTAPYSTATSEAPTGSVSRGHSRDPVADDGRTPTPETSPEADRTTTVPEPSQSASAPAPGEIGGPTSSSTTQPTPSGSESGPPADNSPPETAASTSSSDGDSWTVELAADEAASYQCSLDGSAYQPCGATVTYGDLDRGRHTFTARATDQAGNTDPSPAELSATIAGPR